MEVLGRRRAYALRVAVQDHGSCRRRLPRLGCRQCGIARNGTKNPFCPCTHRPVRPEDPDERGLRETGLVMAMGKFGRTPINPTAAATTGSTPGRWRWLEAALEPVTSSESSEKRGHNVSSRMSPGATCPR
jgi:hypothetical protein